MGSSQKQEGSPRLALVIILGYECYGLPKTGYEPRYAIHT
jgi:hypothetical protein